MAMRGLAMMTVAVVAIAAAVAAVVLGLRAWRREGGRGIQGRLEAALVVLIGSGLAVAWTIGAVNVLFYGR